MHINSRLSCRTWTHMYLGHMSSVERAAGEFFKCGPSSLSKRRWSPELTLVQDQASWRPLGTVSPGKGGADSPLSLQGCASSLLAPSSQMASPGDESASPKMLPRSQDLGAPRRRREEKERRFLFFFLNILGREERSMVGNAERSPPASGQRVWWECFEEQSPSLASRSPKLARFTCSLV